MEFKGTKGKWEVYTPKHIGCTNVKFGSEELDGYIEFWHHHSSEQEQKSNALLISKAPEMLDEINESIKDLLCIQSSVYSACKTDKRWEGVYEIIQKQIDRKKELIKQATEL